MVSKFNHNAVVDLRRIKNNLLREKFVFIWTLFVNMELQPEWRKCPAYL